MGHGFFFLLLLMLGLFLLFQAVLCASRSGRVFPRGLLINYHSDCGVLAAGCKRMRMPLSGVLINPVFLLLFFFFVDER